MAPQSRSKRTKVRGNPLKTQSRAGLTHMNTALPGAAKILNGGFRLDVATAPTSRGLVDRNRDLLLGADGF
jgi:hypothetical protein